MHKKIFLLAALLSSLLVQAFEVVPFTDSAPVMTGRYDSAQWQKALRLEKFTEWKKGTAVGEATVLQLLRDDKVLYLAVELQNENVPELIEKSKSDRSRQPWNLPGIEIFFGEKEYLQLAFDYMGRLYKNVDAPVFSMVNFKADRIVIRCAVPFAILPRVAASSSLTRFNAYRKSRSGVSSCFPNQSGSFLDLTCAGLLLLEKPSDLAAGLKAGYEAQLDTLVRTGGLGKDEAGLLHKELSCRTRAVLDSLADDSSFLKAVADLSQMRFRILEAQETQMQAKYGSGESLLASGGPRREIPDAWRPALLAGRDYWYAFTMFPDGSLEKAGLMDIPLLRDALFYIRWWQPGAEEFLPPEGRNYKLLQKYSCPFAVKSIDRFRRISDKERTSPNLKAFFNREFMQKFYETYGDRFLGFWEDEAFVCNTGEFAGRIRNFNLPEPRNRQEAWKTFQKLYKMQTDGVPAYAGFRNLANMSEYTAGHVGNAAAVQLNHLVHEMGDLISGNEMGDTMSSTAVKTAFARGAARQYARPWRNYQVFYGWSYLNQNGQGMRCAAKTSGPWVNNVERLLTPDCRATAYCHLDGLKCGLGLERQKAVYLYPYLAGAGVWYSESDLEEMTCVYQLGEIENLDPLVINLQDQKLYPSPMLKINMHFYDQIVKKRDRGVTVTPVALVFDRAHGYLPLYFGHRVWDFFNPSEIEKTMWALDNHVFRRDPENPSYSVSRWGDIFDVVTNDAGSAFLDNYQVVYPVGDVTLDRKYASELEEYAEDGGTLILNAALLKRYPEAFSPEFLGCRISEEQGRSPGTYSCLSGRVIGEDVSYVYDRLIPEKADVLAVTTDAGQAPAIVSHRVGKGRVIVTAPENMKTAGSMDQMLNLFDHMMDQIRAGVLEIRVDTSMQYMVNRNRTGWIVYLQNNQGVNPSRGLFYGEPPRTDTSKKASAEILLPVSMGKVSRVIDWWSGKEIPFQRTSEGAVLQTTLPGGDCQALEFEMKKGFWSRMFGD